MTSSTQKCVCVCVCVCVPVGLSVCLTVQMLVLVTTGALLEVGLFVNSPDSAAKEASISPEYQSASDFRCRLAGDYS